MRRLNSVESPAILIAAMLSFTGGASAQAPKYDLEIGAPFNICDCRGACRLVTTCLGNYCIQETRCGDCEVKVNCTNVKIDKPEEKVCLYGKGKGVKTFRRR
jgi:hypothetical protein